MKAAKRLALVGGSLMLAATTLQPATAKDDRSVVRVSGSVELPARCAHEDAQQGSEVEPRVAANPTDRKNLVAVWQQDRMRSSGGAKATGVAASFDGGKSWTARAMPGFGCLDPLDAKGSDPWVSFGPDGRAYVSALVGQDDHGALRVSDDPNGVVVSTSTDRGRTWSPAVRAASGVSFDKPTITADPYRAGTAYLTWSQFSWYTCVIEFCNPASATMHARTDDGGVTWSAPRVVGVSPIPLEQMGNPEISVLPDGTLVAMHVTFEYSDDVPGNVEPCLGIPGAGPQNEVCGRWTIKSQTSTDGGLRWSAPLTVATGRMQDAISDPRAGDSGGVRSSWGWYPFTQAAGRDGTVYAAWFNRRFDAAPADGHRSELMLARSSDGGRSWAVDTAMTFANDVFVPTIDVNDRGVIGLSWYDIAPDQSPDDPWATTVWFASSQDGGSTWARRPLAGPFDMRVAPVGGNFAQRTYFVGDYEGLTHVGNHFVAVFAQTVEPTAPDRREADIFAVRVPMH